MNIEQEIDEWIRRKHYRQINSVVIWQEGGMFVKRYYNGYHEESRNVIKSVAKSILSIAAGIARDQGLLEDLEVPIHRYLPQFAGRQQPLHRAIRLRHLLTMTSGIYWNGGVHYHCPMMEQMRASKDWISHIADCAMAEKPGAKYVYKEWDVILLGKVLDVVCGDLYGFLDKCLYQPLGIASERWYRTPCGVYYSIGDGKENTPTESRSNLSALDMLKIGQLFLYRGMCQGRRILSEQYIKEAVAPTKRSEEYGVEYGYMWWIGRDWYGCRGYGGQSITVVPKKRSVIVTQATPTARGMGYHDLIEWCMERLP